MSKKKSVNATHYDHIPTYPQNGTKHGRTVNAVIETPKSSRHKYALQAQFGIIAFHSVLPQSLEWPFDYGFVPRTLAPDGDPVDVLVLGECPSFSGCLVQARIVGAVRETKDGVENDRLLGIRPPSPGAPMPTDAYTDVADMPRELVERIERFLVEYSALQGHAIAVQATVGAADAMNMVRRFAKAFKKNGA